MKVNLKILPAELQRLVSIIKDLADQKKFPAYLVGGFVRDLLLKRKNLDLDVVLEADGIAFAQDLACVLQARMVTHRRFGTATLYTPQHFKIDIATARKEYYPYPAALPVIVPSCLRDDLFRRDITINTLAISLSQDDFGRLIDFFGGLPDLNKGVIRVLHPKSFLDDPTRILRVVRFQKRFDFRIERNTLSYLKLAVKKGMLHRVQPHRIRDELISLLSEDKAPYQIKRLHSLCGFDFLEKGINFDSDNLKFLFSIQRQINWYSQLPIRHRLLDNWLLYFLGIIDKLDPKRTESLCQKLALQRGQAKRVLGFKKLPKALINELSLPFLRASRIYGLLEPLSYEEIVLLRAKYHSPHLKKNIKNFFLNSVGARLHIRGQDLKDLGLKEGPDFRNLLRQVLLAKLDFGFKTKKEEIDYLKKLIAEK